MSVYLGTNCIDFLKINKNKEREKTVKFIDYDGTILHEYSKDEFLSLSSMPENPSASRYNPLSYTSVVDISEGFLDGLTDSDGKMYFNVWGDLSNLPDTPYIEVDGINWSYQYASIINNFFIDAFNAVDNKTKQAYHNETDSFIINNETYKMVIDWPDWVGKNDVIGTVQFLKLNTKLVPQGWNWSLSDAKTYVQKWDYLNIGQMYTTSSGDTEIDIEFTEGSVRLSPYLGIAINGTVDINWGDNSTHSIVTGDNLTSQIRTQHTYSQPGNYTIKIHVNSGSFAFYGTSYYPLLNNNYGSNVANNVVYSSKVKSIRIGENCSISYFAFYCCYSLNSITIPNGITSIGISAFQNCYSLKSITIPNGVISIEENAYQPCSAFQDCRSLQSITIPNTVISIGSIAFYNCYSLQSITIPDSVTYIGNNAFYGCYSLNTRIISSKVVYKSNYYLNNNITSIDNCTFQNCFFLKSITIPDSVTSIGSYAFQGCYSLQSIKIPNGIIFIDNNTFQYCYSLESITIPDTVTSIGSYAFNNCYSLKSIKIPEGVTSIGYTSFSNCCSLQSITIPEGVTSIDGCYSLKSIKIPEGVTSIGYTSFSNCYSLQSITIPEGVTSIGGSAFYNCYSLSSVTIPDSVTSIGNSSFQNCYYLKEIHLKPTTPPTLGTSTFSSVPSDCIFYVPQGTLSVYQSATGWSDYASKMQEESN